MVASVHFAQIYVFLDCQLVRVKVAACLLLDLLHQCPGLVLALVEGQRGVDDLALLGLVGRDELTELVLMVGETEEDRELLEVLIREHAAAGEEMAHLLAKGTLDEAVQICDFLERIVELEDHLLRL